MASSDRSDGNATGPHAADKADAADEHAAPLEISSRGRIVIRSSSHPPIAERSSAPSQDTSGAHVLPAPSSEPRSKRNTPAERPRRRRQVRAAQAAERLRREAALAQVGSPRRRAGAAVMGDTAAAQRPATATPPPVVAPPGVAHRSRHARGSRAWRIGLAVLACAGVVCLLLWHWLSR